MGTLPPIEVAAAAHAACRAHRRRRRSTLFSAAALLLAALAADAQPAFAAQPSATQPPTAQPSAAPNTAPIPVDCSANPDEPSCPTPLSRSLGAIEAYVTAPARWDTRDWLLFGGTLAAVGVAHHFDTTVRDHFAANAPTSVSAGSPDTLQDALP